MIIKKVKITYRPEMQCKWCVMPYPRHPKGCPRFGKKEECPPRSKIVNEIFDLSKPMYIIGFRFNINKHMAKLKKRHPNWSDSQLRCILYWQPKVRKKLKLIIEQFKEKYPNLEVDIKPEAKAVDVTATMKSVGIILDWSSNAKYVWQVAIAGELK